MYCNVSVDKRAKLPLYWRSSLLALWQFGSLAIEYVSQLVDYENGLSEHRTNIVHAKRAEESARQYNVFGRIVCAIEQAGSELNYFNKTEYECEYHEFLFYSFQYRTHEVHSMSHDMFSIPLCFCSVNPDRRTSSAFAKAWRWVKFSKNLIESLK